MPAEAAPVGFHPALQSPSAQPAAPSAVQPATTAVVAAPRTEEDMVVRSMEQLALLQARAADKGLNADEHRLRMQLTEFLRVRFLPLPACILVALPLMQVCWVSRLHLWKTRARFARAGC